MEDPLEQEEYRTITRETAIYPGAMTGSLQAITYLSLGLVGEAEELLRCATGSILAPPGDVVSEAGDVLWFLTRLGEEMRFNVGGEPPKLESTTYWDCATRILTLSAQISGKVSKMVRDGRSEELDLHVKRHCGLIYDWLNDMVRLSTVRETHVEKLRSRKARGVLGGSGGDR